MAMKASCSHCDARITAGVSFCPTCSQPTMWATHDDRIAWEVEQWRRIRGTSAPRAAVHRASIATVVRRREVEAPPPPQQRPPVVIPRQGPPLAQAGDLSWARREPAPAAATDPLLVQIVSMLEKIDGRFTSLEERLDVVLGARAPLRRTSTSRLLAESLRGLWRGPST